MTEVTRLYVAGPGYGKSAALESALPADGLLLPAEDILATGVPRVSALAVDDLHHLDPLEQLDLAMALGAARHLRQLHLASRNPLHPDVRRALPGPLTDRGPAELAMTPHTVAVLLAEEHGCHDPELPAIMARLTGGWPAAVLLLADRVVAGGSAAGDELTPERVAGACAQWFADNVVPSLSTEAGRLLPVVVALDGADLDLLAALGFGRTTAQSVLVELTSAGLVRRAAAPSVVPWQPVPFLAGVVEGGSGLDRALALAAGAWLAQRGDPYRAARVLHRAGSLGEVTRLLDSAGPRMLAAGHARAVLDLTDAVEGVDGVAAADDVDGGVGRGGGARSRWSALRGEAHRMTGDPERAAAEFAVARSTGSGGSGAIRLAIGEAAVAHLVGDFPASWERLCSVAPSASDTSRPGTETQAAGAGSTPDLVAWHVAAVHTLTSLGRGADARDHAARALALAATLDDPGRQAQAQVAAARVAEGATKERHLMAAERLAMAAADVPTLVRALVSLGFLLLSQGRYREAVGPCRRAVVLSDGCCAPGIRISALHNLGEALARTGEVAEAQWLLRRALALSRPLGDGRRATALLGLGDLHRDAGRDELARQAYTEAVDLARRSQEAQIVVPALAGLALLERQVDESTANLLVAQARASAGETLGLRAWAEIAAGSPQAVALARQCGAVDVLARALEACAETSARSGDTATARALLGEALTLWADGGAEAAVDRIRVLLGRLPDARPEECAQGRVASERLVRRGVLRVGGRPLTDDSDGALVAIEVLGGFTVRVDGLAVPMTAWRSRQARTLVKVLAARPGRPVSREALRELLWPDDDPSRTGHRLSVLLATVRQALDPQRRLAPDHIIAADGQSLWLDPEHVRVDADELVEAVASALRLADDGETRRAAALLADANRRYRGAAFEDEPDAEWAESAREHSRAWWLRGMRRYAELAVRDGRAADAVPVLVRILEHDPYDDRIHRSLVSVLVRSGRHGEASRALHRWASAMRAIGAPEPDPDLLAVHGRRPRRIGVPHPPGSLAVVTPR
jgi:DNA-binding SARP family transcriptional activator/Tfp pilus assembly protein PilF